METWDISVIRLDNTLPASGQEWKQKEIKTSVRKAIFRISTINCNVSILTRLYERFLSKSLLSIIWLFAGGRD